MSTSTSERTLTTGTTVYLWKRTSANGTVFPAETTVVTKAPHVNQAGIAVCRVALWPGTLVRVDQLHHEPELQ